MVAEAEEYVLSIGDSILMSYISLEIDSVLRGVSNRTIFTRGIDWSPEIKAELNREEKVLEATGMRKFLEFRYVDRVNVYMMMSEKEVAGITFRTLDGVFDHIHFSGKDSRFHGWCKDLFEYYWSRSRLA